VPAFQVYEIPMIAGVPSFRVVQLSGNRLQIAAHWCDPLTSWVLDIADIDGNPIVSGIPMITGADLLAQYVYMNFGGMLLAQSDFDWTVPPTFDDLGRVGHLYWIPYTQPFSIKPFPIVSTPAYPLSPEEPLEPQLPTEPPPVPTGGPPPVQEIAFRSDALSVSGDGSVVVGSSYLKNTTLTWPGVGPHAYRWTQATGMVDLGVLPGATDNQSVAILISRDGSTITGVSSNNAGGTIRGFVWTQAEGMVDLGSIGTDASRYSVQPMAISSDGSAIFGFFNGGGLGGGGDGVFKWTRSGGMVRINNLGVTSNPGNRLYMDASLGGAVSVQDYRPGGTGSNSYATQWTQAGGQAAIDIQYPNTNPRVYWETKIARISANGAIAYGATLEGFGSGGPSGFTPLFLQRWTGLPGAPVQTSLGTLDFAGNTIFTGISTDGFSLDAEGISDDGSVTAGIMYDPRDGGSPDGVFYWSAATGLRDIGNLGWLGAGARAQVGFYISLASQTYVIASCMSADGSTVVGTSRKASGQFGSFRWTLAGGMVELPNLGGAQQYLNVANATSGEIVDGSATVDLTGGSSTLVRQTGITGYTDLGALFPFFVIEAPAFDPVGRQWMISFSGSISPVGTGSGVLTLTVGPATPDGSGGWIITPAATINVPLPAGGGFSVGANGTLPPNSSAHFSWSLSISGSWGGNLGLSGIYKLMQTHTTNAGVIVGASHIPDDSFGHFNFHAYRWTQSGGIQDLGTL
jgi:probable HAF family extracellular repeat protein